MAIIKETQLHYVCAIAHICAFVLIHKNSDFIFDSLNINYKHKLLTTVTKKGAEICDNNYDFKGIKFKESQHLNIYTIPVEKNS